jgi:hypothetical protein
MLVFLALFCLGQSLCFVPSTTCYVDTPSRILGNSSVNTNPDGLFNEYCASLCFALNFTLAGTEDSDECYCGDALVAGALQVPSGQKKFFKRNLPLSRF